MAKLNGDLSDHQEICRRIRIVVSRADNRIDVEDLAVKIWIEAWGKDRVVSWKGIKNRCIDVLRNLKVRREVSIDKLAPTLVASNGYNTQKDSDREMFVDRLMECGELTNEDKIVVYERFYRGLSGSEIGDLHGWGKVKANRRVAGVVVKLTDWAFKLKEEEVGEI